MSSFSVDEEDLASLESLRANGLSVRSVSVFMHGFMTKFWSHAAVVRWTYLFLLGQVLFQAYEVNLHWQWFLVLSYLFLSRTPYLSRADRRQPGVFFFRGESADTLPAWLLALSTATCYVTGRDSTESVEGGAAFGVVGGAAAAVKYATLPVVAATAAALRTRAYPGASGFTEIIHQRFGVVSALLFQAIVVYRLYTFVWSNAVAVGDFYSPSSRRHSDPWWTAALLSVVIPLLYTAQRGLRGALYADGLLGIVTACGIVAVASYILADARSSPGGTAAFVKDTARWTLPGGGDALIVSAIEAVSSYGFMDPVLTDRAFLCTPPRMQRAFWAAAFLAAAKVFALSFVGIHAAVAAGANGVSSSSDARRMAHGLSLVAYQVLTLVTLSSAMSALAATFSSLGRLWSLELSRLVRGGAAVLRPERVQAPALWSARTACLFFAMLAMLPLLTNNAGSLHATFAQGTPALGLGWPLFYAAFGPRRKRNGASPLVFLMPLSVSIGLGLAQQISTTRGQDTVTAPFLVSVDHTLLPNFFVLGSGAAKQRLAWTLLTLGCSACACAAAVTAEALISRRPGASAGSGAADYGAEEVPYDDAAADENVDEEQAMPMRSLTTERVSAGSRYAGTGSGVAYESDEEGPQGANGGAAPAGAGEDDDLDTHAPQPVSRRSHLGLVAGVRFSRGGTREPERRALTGEAVDGGSEDDDDIDLVRGITARISHSVARLAGRMSGAFGESALVRQSQGGVGAGSYATAGEEPQEEVSAGPVAAPDGLRPRKSQLAE